MCAPQPQLPNQLRKLRHMIYNRADQIEETQNVRETPSNVSVKTSGVSELHQVLATSYHKFKEKALYIT